MTRLTRRASLLVALNLLTSAATSYAECAWGLWQQQGKASPNNQFFDWSWNVMDGTRQSPSAESGLRA